LKIWLFFFNNNMEDIKVLMSEDGLKTITKIPYTSNF
jgi:hypothetical protein